MKDSNEKKPYEAPHLTVVSFKVEQGFNNSYTIGQSIDNFNDDDYADRNGYGNAFSYSWD